MSVRSSGYRPRRPERRHARGRDASILAGAAVLAVVALAIVLLAPGRLSRPDQPAGSADGSVAAVTTTPASVAPVAGGTDAPNGATQSPPASQPAPAVRVALVPLTSFRSPHTQTDLDEVRAVLDGTSNRYGALELVEDEADAILGALGMTRPTDPARLVLAADAGALAADMAVKQNRLAFLRADDFGPSVRALAWGRHAMFGVGRVASLGEWPLQGDLPQRSADVAGYDPNASWTLVAGGDIMLDRGVYQSLVIKGNGADFPWDGGTAEITSRYCCSSFGWELPRTERTGNEGAVRALFEGADLSLANFENPAPNKFAFHTRGTVFTADPSLIDGMANAGLDWVSLANNHIRDAGGQGILETIENLESRGLRHGGAGQNAAAAHRATLMDAGGIQVGVLGYDAIAAAYAAGPDRVGSAQLSAAACKRDIAAAREAGADMVVVFPHWGVEYDATPFDGQQGLARACLDAGADMVIGNHAHWAGAMELYDGKPIWYALGNFIFDQDWSEPTMEGITLELTFTGTELRQVRMRPHIILDDAQPNFMDPNESGKVVMGQVFSASERLLDW